MVSQVVSTTIRVLSTDTWAQISLSAIKTATLFHDNPGTMLEV